MNLQAIISRNLKGFRLLRGLSQEALAAKVGMGSNHLARIERGEDGLSLDRWAKICKVLKIDPYELLKPDAFKDVKE